MSNPSIANLQAEIATSRARLAGTIDELSQRATPKAIMERQKASARLALTEQADHARATVVGAMQDGQGGYRQDRIIELAAAGAGLLLLGLLARRRRR